MRVLCVENRRNCVPAMKCRLEKIGFDVLSAATAEEAFSVLADEQIEMVLLEYELPGVAGMAVRAEMKLLRPELPMLLFNGTSNQTPILLRFLASYLRNPRPKGRNGVGIR